MTKAVYQSKSEYSRKAITLSVSIIALATASSFTTVHAQQAQPGDANCPIVDGEAICSGDLSDGVTAPPDSGIDTLTIQDVTGDIAPPGYFGVGATRTDGDLTINVEEGVVIRTYDDPNIANPAQGIIGITQNGYDLTINSGADIFVDGNGQPAVGIEGAMFDGSSVLSISNTGDVDISTSADFMHAILGRALNSTGDVYIANSGALNVTSTYQGERGSSLTGIFASSELGGGEIWISNSGDIDVTTDPGSFDTDFQGLAAAIATNVFGEASTTEIINAGALSINGDNAYGIVGFTNNTSTDANSIVTINNVGAVSVDGDYANAILAQSTGTAVDLEVTNTGALTLGTKAESNGIYVWNQATEGLLSVTNSGTIANSDGGDTTGIGLYGIGLTTGGAPETGTYVMEAENSGNIILDAEGAYGIWAFATTDDTVDARISNSANIALSSVSDPQSAGIFLNFWGNPPEGAVDGVSSADITNSGHIQMGAGYAIQVFADNLNLTNSGILETRGDAANAVEFIGLSDGDFAFQNSGDVVNNAGNGKALFLSNEGDSVIDNEAGASLRADNGWAIILGAQSANSAGQVTIDNAGVIMGGTSGVYRMENAGGTLTLTNSGFLTAPDGVAIDLDENSVTDDVIINQDEGLIEGDVDLGAGNDVFTGELGSDLRGDIYAGDGDDVLTFAHSTLNGAIYLGNGDDVLNLSGLNAFDGIYGGDGFDTANYTFGDGQEVSVDITGVPIIDLERFTMSGDGLLQVTGENDTTAEFALLAGRAELDVMMENASFTTEAGSEIYITGSVGALSVGGDLYTLGDPTASANVIGDLTFLDGSTYNARFLPTGESDIINVGGLIDIQGGQVNAMSASGDYIAGDSFVILDGEGGVQGQFDGLTEASTAFLDLSLVYEGNQVLVQLAQTDPGDGGGDGGDGGGDGGGETPPPPVNIGQFADTTNQGNVAIILNGFDTTEGTDTREVFSHIMFLMEDEVADALDQMTGEFHSGIVGSSIARGRSLPAGFSSRAMAANLANVESTQWGIRYWGGVETSSGSSDTSGGAEVEYDQTGGKLGVDWTAPAGKYSFGLGGGYSDGETSSDGLGSTADVSGWHLGAYGANGLGGSGFSISGALAYASEDADVTRNIAFGGLARQATSDYAIKTTSAETEGRYGFPVTADTAWAFGPAARASYVKVERDGFSEDGAGSLNLTSSSLSETSTAIGLGGFAHYRSGKFVFDASALWTEAEAVGASGQYSLQGAPSDRFNINSVKTGGSGADLRASFGVDIAPRINLSLGYKGWVGENDDNHAALLSLSIK